MKHIIYKLCLLTCIAMQAANIHAQEKGAAINVAVETKQPTTIENSSTIYMLPGEKPVINITLDEQGTINKIEKAKINFASSANNIAFDLSFTGKTAKHEFTPETENVDYTIGVEIDYSIKLKSSKGTDSIAARRSVYEHPIKIHQKTKPEITGRTNVALEHYAGKDLDIEIQTVGGGTWAFAWPNGTTENAHYTLATVNDGEGINDQSFSVDVKNYAPDGKTIWFEDTVSFNINTYKSPVAEAIDAELKKMINGDNIVLSGVNYSNGKPGAWEFRWTVNGDNRTIGEENTLPVEAENDTNEGRTDTYTLVVTNKLNNIVEFEKSFNFDVTVFGNPSTSLNIDQTQYLIHGDKKDLAVLFEGGDPSEWKFQWTVDEESEVLGEESTLAIEAKNDDTDVAESKVTYKVIATNTLNGEVRHQKSYSFELYTYHKPTINAEGKSSRFFLNGDSGEFLTTKFGGDPEGWKFEWYYGEELLDGNTADNLVYTFLNENENSIDKKIELHATNTLKNGVERLNEIISFNTITFKTPELKEVIENPDFEIYGTKQLDLFGEVDGGDPEKWVYSWTVDGVAIDDAEDIRYSKQSDNENSTKTYTLTAKSFIESNTSEELVERYSKTITFNVQTYVFPTITATCENNFVLWDSEKLELTTEYSGGKDTWEFEWKENNDVLGETTNNYTCDVENRSLEQRTDYYYITARNSINDTIAFEMVIPFKVTVKGINIAWANELPKNVVEGDTITAKIHRDGGNNYIWEYTITNFESNFEENRQNGEIDETFSFTAGQCEYEDGLHSVLSLNATAEGFTHDILHEFTIWSMPAIEKVSLDDIALLHNQKYTFEIQKTGGLPSGWSYQWYLNGEKINGATSTSYKATMKHISGTGVQNDVYKIIATNVTNNITREYEAEFFAEVWPTAGETHTQVTQDIYYGEDLELGVNVTGGYADGWRYSWDVENHSISHYTYHAVSSSANSTTKTLKLTTWNEHPKAPNGYLYEKEITFTVTSWSHGKITSFTHDLDDYRSGDPIVTALTTNGGYPNNWTFYWYYNDELIGTTTNDPHYTFTAEDNYTDTYAVENIKVVAKNTIPAGKNTLPSTNNNRSTNDSYWVNVWPVEYFADDFTMSGIFTETDDEVYYIREGNSLTLNVETATGGYNANYDRSWRYTWYENGNSVQTSTEPGKETYTISSVTINNNDNKMSTVSREYNLDITNYGPLTNIWYNKVYEKKTVVVYARPETPSQLIWKGNGSSNTLVCMMDNGTDEDLMSKEYTYVFGYTDNQGVDHAMEPTTHRWFQFPQSISIKDSSKKFWVYTEWKYSNEDYVTSGRRFMNSNGTNGNVDEIFDASRYKGMDVTDTRGTTDITAPIADGIHFDGYRITVDPEYAANGTISISAIDGRTLYSESWSNQSTNETIDLSGYPKGIYIISVSVGENRVTKKIIVQ